MSGKIEWIIPKDVLIPAANKLNKTVSFGFDKWKEMERAQCRELCGKEYQWVETDWIYDAVVTLRKAKALDHANGTPRKKYQEPYGKYKEYLESAHWQIFRVKVIQWWGGRCCLCNKRGFDVHHRTYERIHNEELCDCVYLCKRCHKKHHGVMADGNEVFNDTEPAGDDDGDGTPLLTT